MELIEKEERDVVFIQEPYIIHNTVVGITKRYRTFTSTIRRSRPATVITNNQIDALLKWEATDKDMVVVEITLGNLKFYTVNMYLDITEKLHKTTQQINDILQLAGTRGLLIMMASNSRSRTWHDKLTNGRGKKLEEFLISKQLFIMNEDSEMSHKALKIIYNGAILPQLLHAAPVWIDSMKKEYNKAKYTRVWRLISLRIAKAYARFRMKHFAL